MNPVLVRNNSSFKPSSVASVLCDEHLSKAAVQVQFVKHQFKKLSCTNGAFYFTHFPVGVSTCFCMQKHTCLHGALKCIIWLSLQPYSYSSFGGVMVPQMPMNYAQNPYAYQVHVHIHTQMHQLVNSILCRVFQALHICSCI